MRNFRANSPRRGDSRTKKRRGIVLIEFCMAFFCVFLPLTLALIQYGLIIQTMLAMENVSREAGRWAAVKSLNATDDTALRNYIVANASGLGVKVDPTTDITVSKACNTLLVPTNRVQYTPLTITVKYNMDQRNFLKSPFTSVFRIPVFRSDYVTKVVMIMQ